MSHDPLFEKFAAAGQEHVFSFFDRLDAAGRRRLLAEAAEIDLVELERLRQSLLVPGAAHGVQIEGLMPAGFEPLPGNGGGSGAWEAARAAGDAALRAGRVAAFMVAGGQGTRLGYDGPKGTFPVTPVKKKPLFQVMAEKIRAAARRYGKPIPWFIMTSHQNHAETEAFFADRDYFGLDRARVGFFRQGRMPAVTFDGKILLESPGAIALSPDGHGGSLRALERSGALDAMKADGIDTLSYFQVDNPLVRCIDPAFIGWHLLRKSEMSSKMVPKTGPAERVGHFCSRDGRLVMVEYSDLPEALQREQDASGRLRFVAGNTAIHMLDREFARRMAGTGSGAPALPFHRADKKIATIDAQGNPLKPGAPNGVKFELFVFDALPFAKNPLVIETRRADEFSPVKNAEGADSPKTCRDDQLRQAARWLRAGGAALAVDSTGLPAIAIEVEPSFGYDEETFIEAWSRLAARPVPVDGLCLAGS